MNKNLLLFFFSLLFQAVASAAGPITHVYLAEKWQSQNCVYNAEEKQSFILGTLFPDIRYLAKIPRELTHQDNIEIQSLKQCTPFICGKKFHSYVDEKRWQYVIHTKIDGINIHELLHTHFGLPAEHDDTFLKLVEDELLYNMLDKSITSQYLLQIDNEERSLNIPESILRNWHETLSCYFLRPPSKMLESDELEQHLKSVPSELFPLWKKVFPEAIRDARLIEHVNGLVNHFDHLH